MRSTRMNLMSATTLVLSVGLLSGACSSDVAGTNSKPPIKLRASVDNPNILATFRRLPGISIETVALGDSEKRLKALQAGSIDVAVTVADVTYLAFEGHLPDGSAAMPKVRGIALLYRLVVHLLIGPHVNTTQGLRGLRIALGNPGGPNVGLGELLVDSLGLSKSDIHGQFMPYDEAVDKLLTGDVDAAIITGRLPQERVARALRSGARLMEINGPEVNRLRVHYPLLRRTLLPRFTYPSQDVPLHTLGVDLMLTCRADLDDEVVRRLTRSLFEDSPHALTTRTDPQRAPATIVPLHPGAAQYYRQREIER
jgi:TRAP transporter TAXI family solute receptor